MSRNVTLFYVPEMGQENEEAKALLQHIPGVELEELECERSMRLMYPCPFVRDKATRLNYHGLEGIQAFVDSVQQDGHKKRKTQDNTIVA